MINPKAIKLGINVISLAKELGLNVNSEDKILCLLHSEKTPSMQLYPDRAHCFGCGSGVDAISMLQKVKGFNFNEASEYLAQRQGITVENKPTKKSADANTCLSNLLFQKRMTLLTKLHEFTNKEITQDKDYNQAHSWILKRGYDFEFLFHKSFVNSNFLFYTEADLNKFKNEVGIEELKEIELLKSNNQFSWLGGNYNLAFPCWYPMLNTETNIHEWKVTSLKVRHTGMLTDKSKKEVELVLPKSLKDQHIPSSLGFYGLKYWASVYPQVLNQCEGLTVYMTEGPTDMIAGFHLLHKNENTIVLSAGSIHKATHAYNLELIKKCKMLVVAFGNDAAGRTATKTLIEAARKNGITRIGSLKFFTQELMLRGQDICAKRFG